MIEIRNNGYVLRIDEEGKGMTRIKIFMGHTGNVSQKLSPVTVFYPTAHEAKTIKASF